MRVLISGAGIAGPALAWFLAKTGARITVVEKTQSLLPYGQNIDIQGSARKVVQKMGLTKTILDNNTTEKGTQFIDSAGRPFAPLPVKEGASTSFTSEYEILRGDLTKIFYNATKDHPNVKYMFGTTIKEVVSNNDDAVKVELSNGAVQEHDLLVAADGQWSRVRKQCFPAESVKVVDTGVTAVYFTIPRIATDNDWWNVYIGLGSRIMTTRPDPHGTIRAMFCRTPSTPTQKQAWRDAARSDRKTQGELVRKDFADAGWQAQRFLDAMDQAPDYYFQAIQQIKMSKWSNSRVICLGDTAYAPSPLTGMGTSLAILGAYVLAGEISKLRPGEHPSKALDAYEDLFRPFVEEQQSIPSFVPEIAFYEKAWKRWIFHSCMGLLSRIVATPWIASRIGDSSSEEDFPLPLYPVFEDKS